MINTKYYYNKLLTILEETYSNRESINIANIYFEDRFGIIGIDSKKATSINLETFNSDILRFQDNEPVQYIVEKAYFYENFFFVNKNVLIPRQDTELLVHETIKCIENQQLNILEIGTGSGCVALSIADKYPNIKITAIDISPKALNVAKKNRQLLNIKNVEFKLQDFLDRDSWKDLDKYDIIISNPPYIKEDEKNMMSSSTIKHEPNIALFPTDKDYLIFYKTIIEFSKTNLKVNSTVLCELNEFSEKDISNILQKEKYQWKIINDMQDKPRVLKISN